MTVFAGEKAFSDKQRNRLFDKEGVSFRDPHDLGSNVLFERPWTKMRGDE